MMLSGAAAYGKADEKDNALKFGIKLKPHFAIFWIEEGPIFDAWITSIFRLYSGLFGEYGLNDIVGLQIALEGGRYEKSGAGAITRYDYRMLAAVPRFYPVKNSTLCIFVGLWVSWLAAAKWQKYLDGKKDGEAEDLFKEEYNFKRIDLGMPFGLDYEFGNGLLLGFDANMGLTNISKDAEKSACKGYTSSCGLTIGYNLAKLF